MSRQFWAETITWATASGTPVTNTTTETIIFPNVTIPANYMQDGRSLRLRAFGQWSTGTGPPTIIFGLRWNGVAGTVLCKTAACTLVASVTAAAWDLDITMTTRSNGSSGTIMANGTARVFAGVAGTVASATGEGLLTPMTAGGVITPATATVDCTVDSPLSLTATWSASSTSHTLTGLNYHLESLN
jgi:hypothetical protein